MQPHTNFTLDEQKKNPYEITHPTLDLDLYDLDLVGLSRQKFNNNSIVISPPREKKGHGQGRS
jgi:hypothetical protein